MARRLRVEYLGAVYHVMNRGDQREPIFHDDVDRQPRRCGIKTGWLVDAYILTPNHFHLVIETKRLSAIS